jgi:Leucine-rich repeat (LRR) protein
VQCDDFNSRCQLYTTKNYWTSEPDRVKNVCDTASSCCETADHVKVVTNPRSGSNETVGLYNECKCDFWFRLCEDTRGGDACDYAAEYCCGDYEYDGDDKTFYYRNSPQFYCDFFNYAEKEFGHTLKPKALNIITEFPNPCGQFETIWGSNTDYEKVSLEAMYNETNGKNWTNNDGWMNETVDHCQWYGISCDDEGYVTSIDLRDNNLEGQFPVYTRRVALDPWVGGWIHILDNEWVFSKYGLAKLYELKTLDLANNKLTGTIEYAPLYNLRVLTHFDVSGNQLRGEVDALVAPSLTYAAFSSNNFTTMRRFQKYKVSLQTLRYCDVSNNAIQEDANDLLENVPPSIVQFIASNNQINGSLPASVNNLQKLRQFNMSSNALSGELPVFAGSILSLQELDVSNQTNGFTGSIPEDIWRLQSLKILNLAGNRLTSTIPRTIGNMAVLELFDLSNNRLDSSSSIPPELGMLEGE